MISPTVLSGRDCRLNQRAEGQWIRVNQELASIKPGEATAKDLLVGSLCCLSQTDTRYTLWVIVDHLEVWLH